MRIAVFVPDDQPNARYRAIYPMQALAERGHDTTFFERPHGAPLPTVGQLRGFDVAYFWQLFQAEVRSYARWLQAAGIGVIWDNDDDIAALPKEGATYGAFGGIRGHRIWTQMQAMIRQADAVTTTSGRLADLFRGAGQQDVTVIENCLHGVEKAKRHRRGPVVVGWVAASEHGLDVRSLSLRDQLGRALDSMPALTIETVGVSLELNHARYRRAQSVPFERLLGHLGQYDVGIAPLADIPFNRARSNVKVKEYASVGIPWLASPVGEYAGLGEGQGGRLVGDGEWLDQVLRIADDVKARKRLGSAAHKWAKTQTVAVSAHEWERVLERAVARARSRPIPAPSV